jgi:hypothetical protein
MTKREFKSISIRTALVEDVEEFIKNNPHFVRENPEEASVAGFLHQAGRRRLHELNLAERQAQ